jgi:glycerol-3-phosphate cytidylyltransferase
MSKVIGYTQGVYDMFHIGHLNLLKKAAKQCDSLIVGVNSDNVTFEYKHKKPIVPQNERLEIIKSIKYVSDAHIVEQIVKVDDNNKLMPYEKFGCTKFFIGDDHKKMDRWLKVNEFLKKHGGKVVYLPYTKNTSSTKLRKVLNKFIESNS